MIYKKLKLKFISLLRYFAQKNIIFIFGCQRSGTGMLQKIMAKNTNFKVYEEGNPLAMDNYRFKDRTSIKKLIQRNPEQYINFKPLNDSQYADQFLDTWPSAKAIWMYRHYSDTVNSAVHKWGDAQKKIVLWIKGRKKHLSSEDDNGAGCSIYMERMAQDTFKTIKNLAYDNMSDKNGAALLWYLRSSIFFDLSLQNDKRIILMKYEDLVKDPEYHVKQVFDFIGCPIHDKYWEDIFTSSIKKNPSPQLDKEIETACQDMLQKLDNLYKQQGVSR